jgi:3-oxoacyl-[acyl-carrier protein] reductase
MINKTIQKVILVTGSSKGIGKSIAEHYLASSDNLVIGCSRSRSSISNKNYMHHEVDLSKNHSTNDLMTTIKKDVNKLDILINNVGVASMNHLLLTTPEKIDQIIDVNLKSIINLTREASKLIKKEKNGRIINMTTVASPLNLEGESVYVSSKAAIEAFTRVIAKELSPFGITVNAVGPGPVKTDLIKSVPVHKIDKIISQLPSKSYTSIDDILNVLDFFIKKESQLVNGQIIYLG